MATAHPSVAPTAGDTVRGTISRGNDGVGNQTHDSRTPGSLRDTMAYKRILAQSLDNIGLRTDGAASSAHSQHRTLHMVPPRSAGDDFVMPSAGYDPRPIPAGGRRSFGEENTEIARGMADAASVAAAQDTQRHGMGRKNSATRAPPPPMPTVEEDITVGQDATGHGGHDAPNWSKGKSSVVLLGATVLYAIIAEILVNTVDVVLENLDIDEKFLGITLFALVPNTTEFLVSLIAQYYYHRGSITDWSYHRTPFHSQ